MAGQVKQQARAAAEQARGQAAAQVDERSTQVGRQIGSQGEALGGVAEELRRQVAVVLTGPLAQQAGKLLGVGSSVVTVWDIAKWPILVLIVAFMFAVLYYSAPNVKQPGLKAVMPGGALAVIVWILASAAFAFYVANFGSYNKTYGALGGVIVFLVWLWLTNIAILLGAEYNAERARARHIKAGHPPDQEPYLPARSHPRPPAAGRSARRERCRVCSGRRGRVPARRGDRYCTPAARSRAEPGRLTPLRGSAPVLTCTATRRVRRPTAVHGLTRTTPR